MKKYYFSSLVAIAVVAIPAFINAQTMMDVEGATGIGAELDSQSSVPGNLPGTIRQKIQGDVNSYNAQMQDIQNNVQNNQNYRNTMMGNHGGIASGTPPMTGRDGHFASGTPPFPRDDGRFVSGTTPFNENEGDGHDMPRRFDSTTFMMWQNATTSAWGDRDHMQLPVLRIPLLERFASSTAFGSSTLIREMMDGRGHDDHIRLDLFAWQQNNLVDQLTKAMANLAQIRTRIAARIGVASASGIDMTDTNALLVTADSKIAAANQAIHTLSFYVPTVVGSANASTTVDLIKPRQIGADAIKAVNDARKALNDVVVSIAHSLGLNIGGDNEDNGNLKHGNPTRLPKITATSTGSTTVIENSTNN